MSATIFGKKLTRANLTRAFDEQLSRWQPYWLVVATAALAFLGVHTACALLSSAVVGALWRWDFRLAASLARGLLFAWELAGDVLVARVAWASRQATVPLLRQAQEAASEAWRLPLALLVTPLLATIFGCAGAASAAQLIRGSLYLSLRGLSDGFARGTGQVAAALIFPLLSVTLTLPLLRGALLVARQETTVRPLRVAWRELPYAVLLPLGALALWTLWRFLRGWP